MRKNLLIFSLILFFLFSIQPVIAAYMAYPCWETGTPRSNAVLAEGDNITAAVFHNIDSFLYPVNVTFILSRSDGYYNKVVLNESAPRLLRTTYNGHILGAPSIVNNVYINYTFTNLSKGVYNLSSYSTSANGYSQGAIECYYSDWIPCEYVSGATCPYVHNRTNILIGVYVPPSQPVINIINYSTSPTNQNLTIFATVINGTLNAPNYTFTSNGVFTFTATNGTLISSKTVVITNIDKISPTATIAYSTTALTNESVVATIYPSETVTGAINYTFTSNGNHTFIFYDLAGNSGNITAQVTNINSTLYTQTNLNYSFNINILSPINTNYTTNVTTLRFIVYSTNNSAKTCWFFNGSANSTEATCQINTQYDANNLKAVQGYNTWWAYVRDSNGRINSTNVTFFVNTTLPILVLRPVDVVEEASLLSSMQANITNSTNTSDESISAGTIIGWLIGILLLAGIIFGIYYLRNGRQEKEKRLAYICADCGAKFIDNSPQPFLDSPDLTWSEYVRKDASLHTQATGHDVFILEGSDQKFQV